MYGTYHATWDNRMFLNDVDCKITISSGGADIYFEKVYVDFGPKSGNATVSNVSEYDKGAYYWLADYFLEEPVCDEYDEIIDYKEYSGKCAASEDGKTLYIGGYKQLNAEAKYKK